MKTFLYCTSLAALTMLVLATRKRDADRWFDQTLTDGHVTGRLRDLDRRLAALEAKRRGPATQEPYTLKKRKRK